VVITGSSAIHSAKANVVSSSSSFRVREPSIIVIEMGAIDLEATCQPLEVKGTRHFG
jgi:hypothetical protein